MKGIDTTAKRFGPIWLAPDVNYIHLSAFFYASLVTIGMLTFVNFGQTYLLRENFGMTGGEGTLIGLMTVAGELTIMLTVGMYGILCDRIGRRPVYALGMILMGLSYIIYPLASVIWVLFLARVIYAAGVSAATGMLGTVMNDYPQEQSRGKMIALSGMLLGIGAVAANGYFRNLPTRFIESGLDSITAGQYTFWIIAAICIVSGIVVGIGLKPGTPHQERPSLRELAKSGFTEAAKPRTGLSYASAFVARSDMVIIGTFTVLWGGVAGREMGIGGAESAARGVLLFIVAQGAGLVWSPVMGYLVDRFNRVSVLAFGSFISAAVFFTTLLVGDPFDNRYLPLFALLGIGQISVFYSSQALIGQEAPAAKRGSVIGAFATCGAVGILIFSGIGGWLFDVWRPAGAFVLVGIGATLLGIAAVIVRIRWPGPMPQEELVK